MKKENYHSFTDCFKQIDICGFRDELGHPIKNNAGYIALRKMAKEKWYDIHGFSDDKAYKDYYMNGSKGCGDIMLKRVCGNFDDVKTYAKGLHDGNITVTELENPIYVTSEMAIISKNKVARIAELKAELKQLTEKE